MAYENIGAMLGALEEAERQINLAISHYDEGRNELQSAPLEVLARGFVRMKHGHDAIEKARCAFNKEVEYLSRTKIPERLESAKAPNITVTVKDRDYLVSKGYRYSASMIDKAKAIAYLQAGDQNMQALVKLEVNAKTLSSFAKDYITTQGKELPEDLFKTANVSYTALRAK